jgi:hypothetical protein
MNWIVFSYSLPSKSSSSPRVTLWRRLGRLGAVSPSGGIYILPAQDDCIEAFQWLRQEIEQAQGQAVVMHVQQFDGLTDQQLVELFRAARRKDYADLEAKAHELEQTLTQDAPTGPATEGQDALAKLQRQYSEVVQIDYFDCPEGALVAAQLARLAQTLNPDTHSEPAITPVAMAGYRDKGWVTRPQPHVDRLACIWLIRRFINPEAVIRYSLQPEADEISFDMPEAHFGHSGQLCTFETMIRAFDLDTPALMLMAEIVHTIDLRDERYFHPEITGLEAVLKGSLLLGLSDAELEFRGLALFDSLFATLSTRFQTNEPAS